MTELLFEGPSGPRLQKKHLEALARNQGFEFTSAFFPYTSGEIGPYFVHSEAVLKNGQDYFEACKDLANGIKLKMQRGDLVDAISGGETRDWMFSYPVAANLGLPHFSVYKNGRTFGADINGKYVLHLADLNNEGSSSRDYWIPALIQAGGFVRDMAFFVDRMEAGRQVMQDLGLDARALVLLDDSAWDYLRSQDVVTKPAYENILARGKTKEERNAWAEKMLRSPEGLTRLSGLFCNNNTREKVRGILVKGYPYMKDELLDFLRQCSPPGLDVDQWLAKV